VMEEEGLLGSSTELVIGKESHNPNIGHPDIAGKEIPTALKGGQESDFSAGGTSAYGRLGGGVSTANIVIPNSASFKEAVKQKVERSQASPAYLVDLADESPLLCLDSPEVLAHLQSMSQQAVIGRFNGIWPSSSALSLWISENWTKNCRLQADCPQGKKNQRRKNPPNKGGWSSSFPNTASKVEHSKAPGESPLANLRNGPKIPVSTAPLNKVDLNKSAVGGIKRGHESNKSDKSDSDQEQHLDSSENLMLVVAFDQNNWQEVRKKKGKKGRYANLHDYYSSYEE
ncbi:hypothetical protein KI387_034652, partial [Taxus chinensis]